MVLEGFEGEDVRGVLRYVNRVIVLERFCVCEWGISGRGIRRCVNRIRVLRFCVW